MRLSSDEWQKVKEHYNVDRLWSWSMIDKFTTSPFEYFLKYIQKVKEDNDNCAYAPLGGVCHNIIEDLYSGNIKYEDMIKRFEDGFTTIVDIAGFKFDRNDAEKDTKIKDKYHNDLKHFFLNHKVLDGNLQLEKFITINIDKNIFVGYIDAIYKDEDGNYTIIDWKTSTKYSSKVAEEKCGQLVVYAIGLIQNGIPINKIRICWDFLKYVTITYKQANGATKTRDIERIKIGESLQSNAKMWLRKSGYDTNETDRYLKQLLDCNDIRCLPEKIQEKYIINDCFVYVPLTQKFIDNWTDEIITVVKDILMREKDYNETKNNKSFWDSDDHVKSESYYFATLCGYSANLHLPYKKYLESLDTDNNILMQSNISINDNDVDLSWLDEL